MVMRNEVFFRCGSIVLEGVLEAPDDLSGPAAGAVICHPHPLYGGNMYNSVTSALKKGLLERGVACLRFNFRGTGGSEGSHGQGVDELEDVRAAVDYLAEQPMVDAGRIILAGYSFGCWVGLRAASDDPRPSRLIGISPPVDHYDFGFLLKENRPKLLVAGDRDFVCSTSKFIELVENIPEPKQSLLIAGADHFHSGREDVLVKEMTGFLDTYPFGDH
ncbi:MAG: alpha/beta fold hydrolase [Pseudomonadota bacterium]